eukprot:TRINITY_DN104055_c0_g1_i1.p1 TRINITY_DN104055_c0_g1~~TRINITY_DN104055_c0_g1_i1.p1  ORF type:complete len:613 (-),score=63.61 TRINITY_DN104055_c0_g1_i1:266-2104(-)
MSVDAKKICHHTGKKRKVASEGIKPSASDWSASQLRAAGIIMTKWTARLTTVVSNSPEMVRAMATRDRLLLSIADGDKPATSAILRTLGRLTVDREILKVTGLGHLLNDRSLWKQSSEYDCLCAQQLRQKWRWQTPNRGNVDLSILPAASLAVGFRASTFRDRVETFKCWLSRNGFAEPSHLAGLTSFDVDELADRPAMVALLRRALAKLEAADSDRLLRAQQSPSGSNHVTVASAEDFSALLREELVNFSETRVQEELGAMGISCVESLGPRSIIQKLAVAKQQGEDVNNLLHDMGRLIKTESSRKRLLSIASGLRAWNAFEVSLKDYPEGASLPPRCDDDDVEFVSLFKSAKTASNYVGYIRWACVHMSLNTGWRSDGVQQALNGVKKRELRWVGGSKRIEVLLTESAVRSLVTLTDELNIHDGFQELVLISWEFLLRVQSEALPLECGSAEEAQSSSLGPERHSALWVNEKEKSIHLRLARRKNRPKGSWLTRKCTCSIVGNAYCIVHRLAAYTVDGVQGSKLFKFTSHELLSTVRRFLTILEFPRVEQLTLKSFRAGKATEMAKRGCSLGTILCAGEWRSAAFLRYVDEDAVDLSMAFEEVLASDEDP